MGFSLILTGIVFLFLPNIDIIDIMPDFIGIIFILLGLKKLSDLSPHISDAKTKFKYSLYISVAKFILMFFVPYFNNHDEGWILIFTFTFAVLEIIFLLPAFKTMLEGLVFMGDRTGTNAVFENQKEYSLLTSVFFVVRAIMATVPEFSFISNPDYSGTVTQAGGFYLSNYKTLLTFSNIAVTSVFGIIWLIYSVKYFNGIKNDKEFIDYLKNDYKTRVLSNKWIFIFRRIKFALTVGLFGCIFCLDWIVDYFNVIPDVISALLFLWCSLLMKKYIKSKFFFISSLLYLSASVGDCVYSTIYALKFPAVNLWTNYKAYNMFVNVNIIHSISVITSICVFISFFILIGKIIKEHTGSGIIGNEGKNSYSDDNLYLKKSSITFLVFSILSALVGILRYLLLYSVPAFYLVDWLMYIVWVIISIKLISKLNSSVEYKYL